MAKRRSQITEALAAPMPAPLAATGVRNGAGRRSAILRQAIAEFAREGVAGARTAAIADAAGVNKALLYYYFKDKESLYSAVLHSVFSGLAEDVLPMLEGPLTPGEKVLRFARAHFEYLIRNPNYPRLIQQELSRARIVSDLAGDGGVNPGEPLRDFQGDFRAISRLHFIPLQRAGVKAIEEGIAAGEFRKVPGPGTLSVILAMNVFYFSSAPIMRMVRGVDPFSAQSIRGQIAMSLDFIGASLFADRNKGIRLASKIAGARWALPRGKQGK